MLDLHIYQLNYGIEYQKGKYADSKSTAYLRWYVTENQELPDRNIGVLYLRHISTRIIAPWLRTSNQGRVMPTLM
jgi:hypothetical protein